MKAFIIKGFIKNLRFGLEVIHFCFAIETIGLYVFDPVIDPKIYFHNYEPDIFLHIYWNSDKNSNFNK